MTKSSQQRPYFCLAAFPDDTIDVAYCFDSVSRYLENTRALPQNTGQYELAAEAALRKDKGLDPNHDQSWQKAGIEGGRAEAVRQIRNGYLLSAENLLTDIIPSYVKTNPYDFTPSAFDKDHDRNQMFFDRLHHAFARAHLEQINENPDYLLEDEAWHLAGLHKISELPGIVGLHKHMQNIFVDARVGAYVAHEIGLEENDTNTINALSRAAADHVIRRVFPQIADALSIPKNTKAGLEPVKSEAAAAFGQARDFTHS